MDYSNWLNRAIDKIEGMTVDTEFVLKDLFDGVDWNALPKSDRLGFGRFFKNEVMEGNIENIHFIGKAQNNSSKYRKAVDQQ